jgi:hypothetical protein
VALQPGEPVEDVTAAALSDGITEVPVTDIPFIDASGHPSLEARLWLAELLADAERRGLGRLIVDFEPAPGEELRAADFIEARGSWLADRDDPA